MSHEFVKREADRLLKDLRVVEILSQIGEVAFLGSYDLDLMVWPEIDICIYQEDVKPESCWAVISSLSAILPPQMVFVINQTDVFMWHGIPQTIVIDYRLQFGGVLWKLDIVLCPKSEQRFVEYNAKIKPQLTPEVRRLVMSIKSQAVSSDRYYKSRWSMVPIKGTFSAREIIRAVLDDNVRSFTDFTQYLMSRHGISAFGTVVRANGEGV